MGWLAEAWRPRHRGPGWPPGARLRAGRAWVLPPLIGWRLPSGRGGTGQPNVTGEAAGHYRRPLIMAGVCPGGWQVMEVNLAHVAARRRVNRRRGVKTGRVDLVAIADLLLAGRGCPVVAGEEPLIGLAAWVTHRRRDEVRTATKNQLLAQLERAFPGRGLGLRAGGVPGHEVENCRDEYCDGDSCFSRRGAGEPGDELAAGVPAGAGRGAPGPVGGVAGHCRGAGG